jgi:HD superfamily phosphohydrolase
MYLFHCYMNSNLLSKPTIFKDIIHDSIEISLVAKTIIDTKIFQRLRNLHQLGVCYLVFPNANHNRFEHSIGTYHLAGILIEKLVKNSIPIEINKGLLEVSFIKNYLLRNFDLEDTHENIDFLEKINTVLLDDYLIELIKIAGLVHDIGHGPFSHLFDEWLHNNNLISNDLIYHESRSIILLQKIVMETNIEYEDELYNLKEFINDDAFNFISELINPNINTPKNFIFQIISNSLNGLDVDKLDYLNRDSYYLGAGIPFDLSTIINHVKVINKNICFPEKISYDIYKVYRSRYDNHKLYYNNKTTICIEYMIRDILEKLDGILLISDNIKNNNLDNFIDMVDSSILNTSSILKNIPYTYHLYKEQIDYIESIIDKIYSRKLYKCIYSNSFSIYDNFEADKIILDFIISYETKHNIVLDKDKIIPIKLKIGLLSGNKSHPIDNIYFYDSKNNSLILEKNKISNLMSPLFQELILYILYKN